MTCEKQVQIKDKYCLTIDEAAEYFNIGEKKLRKIVADYLKRRSRSCQNQKLFQRAGYQRIMDSARGVFHQKAAIVGER